MEFGSERGKCPSRCGCRQLPTNLPANVRQLARKCPPTCRQMSATVAVKSLNVGEAYLALKELTLLKDKAERQGQLSGG